MGVMIVLISVYINSYQVFTWNPELLLEILLAAAPEFIWIGNIMFSNNICDAEEDRLNHRYTIVHYLGVPHSVFLFNAMNILAILLIFLAIFFRRLPSRSHFHCLSRSIYFQTNATIYCRAG